MIDTFVLLSPILLLCIVALVGLLGCNQVYGLHGTHESFPIASVDPSWGSPAGGTAVTITTSGANSGATVAFGGAAVDPEFVHITNSSITVDQTPRHSPGAVDVVVTNTDESRGTLSSGFTYGVAETGTALNYATGVANLQLAPVEGQLVVVVALWSGAGALTLNSNPATTFTLIKQADLGPNNPPNQPVHVAVYFANNLSGAVAVSSNLTGGGSPRIAMVATAYDFVATNLALTPDQFSSLQGSGTSLALPLSISDLAAGDLIYATAVSLNSAGQVAGGVTAPAGNDTIIARTQTPIPAYLLVEDHVVLPPDLSASPFSITATATDPTGSWFIFGMRVRVGAS